MNRTQHSTRRRAPAAGMFVRDTATDVAIIGWSLLVLVGLLLPIPGVVTFLVIPAAAGAAAAVLVVWWRSARRTTDKPADHPADR